MLKKLFLLLLLLVSSQLVAETQQYPNVIFILDGSNSMWGQLSDKQAKITIAQQTLTELINNLPAEVPIGLASYGHRRKKSCKDIEMLIAPQAIQRDKLLKAIHGIKPKGMTPIAQTLTQLTANLNDKEKKTIIILISDGKETCHEDACSAIHQLHQQKAFTLHVVGFAVNQEEQTELKCLAKAGGGRYYAAKNTKNLQTALATLKKEIEKKSTNQLGKLNINFPANALASLEGIKIIRSEDNKLIKIAELSKASSYHPLLANKYQLFMNFANTNNRPPTEVFYGNFTIAAGETTTLQFGAINFKIDAALKHASVRGLTLSDSKTGKPVISMTTPDNNYYIFQAKPLPAGNYDLALQYFRSPQPLQHTQNIVVTAGLETQVEFNTGIQLKKPKAANEVISWQLTPKDTKKPLLIVERGEKDQEPLWRTFAIPAGQYYLKVNVKDLPKPLETANIITITKGELLEFDTGL